jgi:hypothetical protein
MMLDALQQLGGLGANVSLRAPLGSRILEVPVAAILDRLGTEAFITN